MTETESPTRCVLALALRLASLVRQATLQYPHAAVQGSGVDVVPGQALVLGT